MPTITTQKTLRASFWRDHPQCSRKTIADHSGIGRMHCTDTRVAFVDWLDLMQRVGLISDALADRATLMPTKRVFEFEVQGDYGHGFECLTSALTYREARVHLREYRENAQGFPYRIRRIVSKG